MSDRHSEIRSAFNTMRDDYVENLVRGVEDDKIYDRLLAMLAQARATGNLPDDVLIPLLAFAVRRLAIKRIERAQLEQPVPLHTFN